MVVPSALVDIVSLFPLRCLLSFGLNEISRELKWPPFFDEQMVTDLSKYKLKIFDVKDFLSQKCQKCDTGLIGVWGILQTINYLTLLYR